SRCRRQDAPPAKAFAHSSCVVARKPWPFAADCAAQPAASRASGALKVPPLNQDFRLSRPAFAPRLVPRPLTKSEVNTSAIYSGFGGAPRCQRAIQLNAPNKAKLTSFV